MADPDIAEVTPNPPLEITVTRKPVDQTFTPEGKSNLGAGGAQEPQPIVETENMGDQFLKMTQLQQGRAARQMLDQLSVESAPKAAAAAIGSAVAASSDTVPAPEGGPTSASDRSFGDSVGAVTKDIGRGLTQAPRAIVQGAGEAVKQVGLAADSLGTWLDEKAGKLDIPLPTSVGRVLIGPTSVVMSDEQVKEWMANPGKAIANMVPSLGKKPDTVTAGIVHDAAQFLTGMVIGGKALEGAGIVLTGFGKVAATGAFSDFAARDPDAERLANLAQKWKLTKPLGDFMAAKPDDNEAVKRLKSAVEGLGMGVLTEGFMRGAALIRSRLQAGQPVSSHGTMLKTMEEDAAARYGRMSEEAMALIGDPKAPLVKAVTPGQKASVAARRIETAGNDMASTATTDQLAAGLVKTTDAGGKEVYVNFARIEGTEDVKKTIGLMADAGKARIDAKRGGEKVTFGRMEELAADLGMDVTDLLSRRSGAPMSAAEALAARSLLTASAERLTELAKNIAAGTARPAEEFAFRRQMAVHAAIQAEVIAARTETARALASWNIPRGGGIEASKAIHDTLEAMGGSATTQELARRLSILNASGASMGQISDFVRKSVTARTIDAAMEAWKSAMLSGPTTHLSNIFSNTLTMGVMTGERKVGELISQFRGTAEGVAAGEANAMAHGMVEASRDAFRMAWMALKTGNSEFGRAAGKTDLTPQRAISREALGLPDNVWGNSVDYIGKGFNIPFRFLTAEDEFFKTMTFRMELHAQAQRVAQSEGLTGAAASARMRQVIDNPPEVVRLAATDHALAATYNRELTGALAKVAQARGDDGAVGRAMQFVLPFFRTPVNVFSASVERSPLAFLTQQFRADVAAGGARQDLALARMATGTTIMLVAADMADQGLVTGMISKDPGNKEASERQGVPQYSIKIGDKWVSYNRLDPIAMPIAIAANMAELARRFEVEPDKLDSVREIMAAAIGGTAQAALNRSFMQGTAGLVSAISDPEQHADQYTKQTLAGFFTPAISATAAQLADPTRRETFDAIDAIEARIIGLSKTLIPRMDLWGRDIRLAESGAGRVFDVISPVKVESERPNPIDAELQRLNFFPKRIDKRGSWDGAPVEFSKFPEVYAEYVRLAGNGLKLPEYDDKGAMDFLNGIVEGKSGRYPPDLWRMFTDGPEGGKAQQIQEIITKYRKAARREIEQDPRFAEFRQYLAQQGTEAAVKKAPTEEQRQIAPMIPRGATMQ